MPKAPNIVLVHGAWANGSSWSKVIPLLLAKGFNVAAAHNPLSSPTDDVASTTRLVNAQVGPVLLVGHSYGGYVITEVGNNPKVVGMVYVAAFGPDTGETLATTAKDFAPAPVVSELQPIADGYLLLSPKGVTEDFVQDLPDNEKNTYVSLQAPTSASIFGTPITNAAWHTKPSWYAVAANDRTINPDYERFAAKRMGATTITVEASHVAMLAQSQAIADLIIQAATKLST
ncbi:MAG TPA: alpha/beta hydrolase [Edaphobacter sp.]|jgi:pimeloyl-ACP methyl ester carboxylesterase|nr:alpha/beta hydrolase [Edaphobacter sp.]